jgi:hypothetical protein
MLHVAANGGDGGKWLAKVVIDPACLREDADELGLIDCLPSGVSIEHEFFFSKVFCTQVFKCPHLWLVFLGRPIGRRRTEVRGHGVAG